MFVYLLKQEFINRTTEVIINITWEKNGYHLQCLLKKKKETNFVFSQMMDFRTLNF